ncbi:hypothetical protein [Bacillus sp. KH172YL63]|uniref:hypothetical protein n=1 Tax=Bacillus sp. KH172YL63 TaxID=2709784 RepID=UPI0013E42FB9|nr:hypothetical protein [Bacillus sp. KH172YL63]BCB03985.1 hypothetical protein KH172YL63_21180 [Bacillus sp. KH172YL63]
MDELKQLRGLMKEEVFKHHGFTGKMRKNILHEVHSKRQPKSFSFKKPVLGPLMSWIFVAACLSVFVYFGGTQLGLIDNNNASAPFYDYKPSDRPPSLPGEYKFLTKSPFEVKNVTSKTSENPMGPFDIITLEGSDYQKLKISFQTLSEGTDLEFSQKKVKVGESPGSYSESAGPATVSHISWIEDGRIKYEMEYTPGHSGETLTKDDMIQMAESFSH